MENLSKNKLKYLRSLRLKKGRDENGCFVIEGQKMVLEALDLIPERVLEVFAINPNDFEKFSVALTKVTPKELEQISSFKTPNKVVAIIKTKVTPVSGKGFGLVLDTVQDPGNLGTIIRMADWFGIPEIICSKETADCLNPKVIQASMGSIFRIAVHYTDLNEFLAKDSRPKYGALLQGENVYSSQLNPNGLLIMGNEGQGISSDIQYFINHPITIPRFGEAESLNVSTATAILLSEFFRTQS